MVELFKIKQIVYRSNNVMQKRRISQQQNEFQSDHDRTSLPYLNTAYNHIRASPALKTKYLQHRFSEQLVALKFNPDKCFYFDSEDEYIRKILISYGYHQIKLTNDRHVQLMWVYNHEKYMDKLCEVDLYNHFRNSHVLTTKQGLRNTLYKNCNSQIKVSSFYPRSYDLHSEMDEFAADFENTAILNILKKIIVCWQLGQQQLGWMDVINPVSAHQISSMFLQFMKCKNKFANTSSQYLNIPKKYLIYTLIYLEKYKNTLDVFQDCIDVDDNVFDISKQVLDELLQFSKLDPPYITKFQDADLVVPNQDCMQLLLSYSKYFQTACQYYRNDGFNNIWIVKPSQSSKGRNLQLISSKKEIKNQSNTCRIVQKYIQNIWIFTDKQLKHYENPPAELRQLVNKKFDIRLWVLVLSYDPLQIYLFDEGYLRLTSLNYRFGCLKNLKQHLTNYSVNKQNLAGDQSFLLLSDFLKHLRKAYGIVHLRQELQKVIVNTLKCADISNSKQSFQLYGFDILLDCDLKPWILEVNLSPACQERGKLKAVLYDMGESLLEMVGLVQPQQSKKYLWKPIYIEQAKSIEIPNLQLQIIGQRLDNMRFHMVEVNNSIRWAVHKIQHAFKPKGLSTLTYQSKIQSRAKNLVAVLAKIHKDFMRRCVFQGFKRLKKTKKRIRVRKSKKQV